jgi:hypothetical protein
MGKSNHYIKKLARFGCFSISLVYLTVGLMAVLSLAGESKAMADEERIVDVLLSLPFGEAIISVMILGLAGYIIWRVYEAFTDPYEFGSDYKGIAKRTGIGLSAIGYLIIGFSAAQILFKGGGGNGEEDQQMVVSTVLSLPGGAWLVGISGAITVFAGLIQFKYVGGGEYLSRIKLDEVKKSLAIIVRVLAWAGYIARGIILSIIGYFIIRAAVEFDPEAVGDTDSAFDFIGDSGKAGNFFFALVAGGTICYGLFMIFCGIFYRFEKKTN